MSTGTEAIIGQQKEIIVIPDKYKVIIDPTHPYILFELPYSLDHNCWQLQPPNLLGRHISLLEFKHYRKNGSKFWSKRPGVNLFFAVDKQKIRIMPKEGLSYPELKVGAIPFSTSVSGGGGPIWTDYLSTQVSCMTNLPKRILMDIANAALTTSEASNLGIQLPKLENTSAPEIDDALARQAQLHGLVKGQKIMLKPGFTVRGDNTLYFESRSSSQKLLCTHQGSPVAVSLPRVDWVQTATQNQKPFKTSANLNQNNIPTSSQS